MIAPTVHLNGTDGEELLRQLEAAYTAVQAAITAVMAAAPNARDYYVQGNAYAFRDARNAHDRHLRALQIVRDDLVTSGEHVQDQIAANEARKAAR